MSGPGPDCPLGNAEDLRDLCGGEPVDPQQREHRIETRAEGLKRLLDALHFLPGLQ